MRISAKSDYTCKALLELVLHWPNEEPLAIHEIAQKQAIPLKYLAQILLELKNVGLVNSIRGKEGGYILVRAADTITLAEVVRVADSSLFEVTESARKKESVFATIWQEIGEAIAEMLEKITFEDIANKARGMKKTIYYQI